MSFVDVRYRNRRRVLGSLSRIARSEWKCRRDSRYAQRNAVRPSPFQLLSLRYSTPTLHRFLLGIGVGAEYPCGSVSASEQSEESGISKNAQHRWFTLATSEPRYLTHPPSSPEWLVSTGAYDDRF